MSFQVLINGVAYDALENKVTINDKAESRGTAKIQIYDDKSASTGTIGTFYSFEPFQSVQIIDTNISKSNPYYKAITESAVATLYNPLCSQLKLPLNKYESWKDLKITIDYSWIKN